MKLALQTTASMVFGLAFFGLALFLPAGTFRYWEAWTFLAVFFGSSIVPTACLLAKRPDALRRRLQIGPTAETRPAQRIIISATVLLVALTYVVCALDHRYGCSSVPMAAVIVGNVVVGIGIVMAQVVVVQNGYAGASISVEADQPLVSTGLYGLVRHPMYLGVVINMIGTPLALDSLWGFVPVALAVPVLAARISDEERMLTDQLPGYPAYTRKVRSRLVPTSGDRPWVQFRHATFGLGEWTSLPRRREALDRGRCGQADLPTLQACAEHRGREGQDVAAGAEGAAA